MQLSDEGGRKIDAALDRLDRLTVVANPDKVIPRPADQHDDREPSPAELGDTMTVEPGAWTPLDEIGTEIYVYGDRPVDIAVQYAAVESELRQLRGDVKVHERRYLAVQRVLDSAIGVEATHGTGAGLVADVALLAQRYADLKARTISGGWPLVIEEVEAAELRATEGDRG